MPNRLYQLADRLRLRLWQMAALMALATVLLLAPWVAEAQSGGAAPVFTEGASAWRAFNETLGDAAVATASNIGAAVAATDTDDVDTLTYFLEGTDAEGTDAARFGIISTSGQLRTKVGEKYDYEAKSSYAVTVRVEDGNGGSDTIAVTVNVTNQSEPPLAPRLNITGANATSVFVTFYPPTNPGRPAITHYDARYRANNEGEWIDVPRDSVGLYYYSDSRVRAEIPNLEQRTLYYAQVRATNAEGDGAWSESGYITTGYITPPTTYVWYESSSYTAVEGGADATVTVVLSRAPSRTVSFPIWKNAHLGGATSADYTGIPDNVTFNAGQRRSTFTVRATDDSDDDDGESVRLGFRTLPRNFLLGYQRATTVVLDDNDSLRNVVVDFDTSTNHTIEVREHIWPFRITLSLNHTPGRSLEIPLVVTELGGATEEDYTGIPASVTFGADETDAHFSMYAIPDQEEEVGEGLRIDFGTLPPGVRSWGYETVEFVEFGGSSWGYEPIEFAEDDDTGQATTNNSPNEGPGITGLPRSGEALTATTSGIADADGLENASFSYQWVRHDLSTNTDTDIPGATGSIYTVTPEDRDHAIKIRVSFTDDAGNDETLTSFAILVLRPANTPAAGAPAVTGTAQVGETLTADTSSIADDEGLTNVSYSYQWIANDGTSDTDIPGATDSAYTLATADGGKTIKVKVSFADDAGNGESLTSTATEAVSFAVQTQTANTPATGRPTIGGTAQVGDNLTADTSGIADADGLSNVSYSYQWVSKDGSTDTDITDATDSSYTLVDADEGKTIKARVSFTDDADNEESLTSAATAEVAAAAPADLPGRPLNLTGAANAEGTVTLSWDAPNDDTVTGYRILRRKPTEGEKTLLVHVNDTGSTATEYTDRDVTPDVGHAYRVKAINAAGLSRWSNFVNVTPTQPAEPVQNSPATGRPTIGGTTQVGEMLTASTSGIADADGLTNVSYSYQWIRNDGSTDTDIRDATGFSHTLADADEGNTIKVRVSFTDDAGNDESLASAATATVAARPNTPATGAPTISGTAQVGETLTADTSSIADAEGLTNVSYSYRWIRRGSTDTDILDATGSTHTLVDADEGKTIKVQVSFADDADNEETLTSTATDEVGAPAPTDPPGAPRNLTGAANADGTVILSWDAANDDTVTGYQILRRRPTEGENTLLVHVNDTGSTATEYTDRNVTPDVRHAYRVKAINAVGLGKQSNYVAVTPTQPAADPPPDEDEDTPPAISVTYPEAREEAGAALAFQVTLDRASSSEVTVDWRTQDNSARAGQDYVAGTGTVVFAPGQTEQTVNVSVLVDDDDDEPRETMLLRLSDATGATIAMSIGVGIILP